MKLPNEMTDSEMINCPADSEQMQRLRAIMHRLRAPGGCPWDAEQTHQSIVSNMIEEAYEAVDTIRRGDMPHMQEELGDVLLQVVFHAELAEEAGHFNFDDVARGVSEKLVRRHPHVYATECADSTVTDASGVLTQWDAIKKLEKGDVKAKSYLEGVGDGLPAILKAAKVQKKASKVGFDWPTPSAITEKIDEELAEVREELEKQDVDAVPSEALKNEIGDLLFVVVNLARKLKLNPEELIDRTNHKFVNRFARMERALEARGLPLTPEQRDVMEEEWLAAKKFD